MKFWLQFQSLSSNNVTTDRVGLIIIIKLTKAQSRLNEDFSSTLNPSLLHTLVVFSRTRNFTIDLCD